MPIKEILEKSFKYPWEKRSLWFYGILLALFSAGSTVSNQYDSKEGDFNFLNTIDKNVLLWGGVILGLLAIIIGIVALIVSAWSKAAIMGGVKLLEEGKEITRKEIGKTGKRPVWKLIVLDGIIPFLIFLLLALVVGAFALLFYVMPQPAGLWAGIAVGVIAFFALIPFLIYWGMIWILAGRFVVIEKKNAWESLKLGREMIKGNFWWTFLLTLVQGFITGMGSFVAILPFVFLVGIAVFFAAIKVYVVTIIFGVLCLAYLFVYVIVMGYFIAFRETGLTIWWLKLKGEGQKETKKKIK